MPENEEPELSEYEKKMARLKAKLEKRNKGPRARFQAKNRAAISQYKKNSTMNLDDGPS